MSFVCKKNNLYNLIKSLFCFLNTLLEIYAFKNVGKRKEVYILFHDSLNTFYLRLYGIGHMVKRPLGERKLAAATGSTPSR